MNCKQLPQIVLVTLATILVTGLVSPARCTQNDVVHSTGERSVELMKEELMDYEPKTTDAKVSESSMAYEKQIESPDVQKSQEKKKYKFITIAVPDDFNVETDLDEALLRNKRATRVEPAIEEPAENSDPSKREEIEPKQAESKQVEAKKEPEQEKKSAEEGPKDTKAKEKSTSEEKPKKSYQKSAKLDKKRAKRDSKSSHKGDKQANQKNKEFKEAKKSQKEKKNQIRFG